jgi:hypothetical protein
MQNNHHNASYEMTQFMKRTLIYTLFALFATTYSSLHAGEDTIVTIHQLPRSNSNELMPLTQGEVFHGSMSKLREKTIRTTFLKQTSIMSILRSVSPNPSLPEDLISLVIAYAQPSDEKEANRDAEDIRLAKFRKIKLSHTLISALITVGGIAEFLTAIYDLPLDASGSWQLPLAYTGIACSSVTLVSSYFLPVCAYSEQSRSTQPRNKTCSITSTAVNGLMGSIITLGASLAPCLPFQYRYIPLGIAGGCGIVCGTISTGWHACKLW